RPARRQVVVGLRQLARGRDISRRSRRGKRLSSDGEGDNAQQAKQVPHRVPRGKSDDAKYKGILGFDKVRLPTPPYPWRGGFRRPCLAVPHCPLPHFFMARGAPPPLARLVSLRSLAGPQALPPCPIASLPNCPIA